MTKTKLGGGWYFTLTTLSLGGWRDGSEVKSTVYCSSRDPEFNSQQPQGGSRPSVMKSGALFWPAGIYAGRIHIINKYIFFKTFQKTFHITLYIYVYIYIYVQVHHGAYAGRGQRKSCGSWLSYHVGPTGGIQVRLSSKPLYPLSHFTGT